MSDVDSLPPCIGSTADPFWIDGPALISFSGGRTSAYMLWRILQAHGGELPPDVVVQFANTGKEREETLRFVHEVGLRWNVPVHWLEWRPTPADVGQRLTFQAWLEDHPGLVCEAGYAEVGYNSASRQGEPFLALIAMRQYAPNAVTRFCSQHLKVEAAQRFAQHALGWERWTNHIGLRHDEGHRVLKAAARDAKGKEPFTRAWPLAIARITKRDVLAFWWGEGRNFDTREMPQGFDLNLRDYEGNCDLCFLKSREKKITIIRENPGVERWWMEAEVLAPAEGHGPGRAVRHRVRGRRSGARRARPDRLRLHPGRRRLRRRVRRCLRVRHPPRGRRPAVRVRTRARRWDDHLAGRVRPRPGRAIMRRWQKERVMKFVMIERRSGELIPVNPGMVCYVRQVGMVTTVSLANGHEHKVAIPAAKLIEAFEAAMSGEAASELREQPRLDLGEQPDPPRGANPPGEGAQPPERPAPPEGEPLEGEGGLSEEEQAELEGRAQRGQEGDGDPPHPRTHKK
jgi:3'-phosphoadenosine 5'-phosphosulfate sulfotransferase (PAPS reductase)/FAD synthetase